MSGILIWASGYNRMLLSAHHASRFDLWTLERIGAALLFSVMWVGATTALAAWSLAAQAAFEARALIAAAAFCVGASFVTVLDRAFIFAMDSCQTNLRKSLTFGAVRILVVLSIGLLADVGIMPVVMGHELALHSTTLREDAEEERFATLTERYDTAGAQTDMEVAHAEFDSAQEAAITLPDPIVAGLAAANRCYRGLPPRRASNYDERRHQCNRQSSAARAVRDEYQREANANLREAEMRLTEKRGALDTARANVADQFESSAQVYSEQFTVANFSVFFDLVTTQTGAAIKALMLLIIHLTADLLPFLVKGYFGRTGVGARISAQRRIEQFDAETAFLDAHSTGLARRQLGQFEVEATLAALARPSMKEFMESLADERIRIVQPLDQAHLAMREAADAGADIDAVPTRRRSLSRLKSVLLERAIAASLNAAASIGISPKWASRKPL